MLIVEDEPTDALLLLKALKGHVTDATIELASSGVEALSRLTYGEKPNTFSGSVSLARHLVHYWVPLDQRSAA